MKYNNWRYLNALNIKNYFIEEIDQFKQINLKLNCSLYLKTSKLPINGLY